MKKYFKKTGNTKSISLWESKGLSDEVFKPPIINNSPAPKLECVRSCPIKQDFYEKTVNIYIVYDLDSDLNNFDPTLENCLFGAIKITKNSDMNKFNHSGYGIGFDSKGPFSHPTGSFGNNAIIFGADMNSSTHSNKRANNSLVLCKDFIQGINGTTIYAEKMYSDNFSATRARFILNLLYNGDNSYLFGNGKEMIKFKAKGSETFQKTFLIPA